MLAKTSQASELLHKYTDFLEDQIDAGSVLTEAEEAIASRAPMKALRVGVLIASQNGLKEISEEVMLASISFVEYRRRDARRFLETMLGYDEQAADSTLCKSLEAYLLKYPDGRSQRQLMQATPFRRYKAHSMKEALRTLLEDGTLQIHEGRYTHGNRG
jgi:hypothetical protein